MDALLNRPGINWFHVIFVSVLLMVVGFAPNYLLKNKILKLIFPLMGIVGIIVLLYHSYRIYTYYY